MILNEGLKLYASHARVQPYCLVGEYFALHASEAGEFVGPKMDALIRDKYDETVASQIVGKEIHDRFNDEANICGSEENPIDVDVGFVLFCTDLDFNRGILSAVAIEGHGDNFDAFFWPDSDHLATSLNRPTYDADFTGLRFPFSDIELLLPNASLQPSLFAKEVQPRSAQLGRPPRWDWEGALAMVVGEAQKPDGLPTGPGAQARIEEMIAAWFTLQTGDCPAPSQVRQRAAKIMQMLEKP